MVRTADIYLNLIVTLPDYVRHIEMSICERSFNPAERSPVQAHVRLPVDAVKIEPDFVSVAVVAHHATVDEIIEEVGFRYLGIVVAEEGVRDCTIVKV